MFVLGCNACFQEVSRCCTRCEAEECIVYRWGSRQMSDPPWLWNQGQTPLEVQNRSVSGLTKWNEVLQKLWSSQNEMVSKIIESCWTKLYIVFNSSAIYFFFKNAVFYSPNPFQMENLRLSSGIFSAMLELNKLNFSHSEDNELRMLRAPDPGTSNCG